MWAQGGGSRKPITVFTDALVSQPQAVPPTHHSSLKRCRWQRSPRERGLGTELGRWYSRQRRQSSTIPGKAPRCLHENVNSSGAVGPGHCPVPCLPLNLSSSALFTCFAVFLRGGVGAAPGRTRAAGERSGASALPHEAHRSAPGPFRRRELGLGPGDQGRERVDARPCRLPPGRSPAPWGAARPPPRSCESQNTCRRADGASCRE